MGALNTVLIGFGRIAQANAADTSMARKMRFSTHAQVLKEHRDFSWRAVVDPRTEAIEAARDLWGVPWTVPTLSELPDRNTYEIAVIATPPRDRLAILDQLPALKGVLVEKPLGETEEDSRAFVEECERRDISLQVNFLRRADSQTRELACGGMALAIGEVQAATGVYCHGLLNNGIHVIDLARMLLGEVVTVQAVPGIAGYHESPLENDLSIPFTLVFESGVALQMQPLKLECYRENGLEIWGENGKLSYLNSGFTISVFNTRKNSLVTGEQELNFDEPQELTSTMGMAFFEMYTSLAASVVRHLPLFSPGSSALKTMEIADCILRSHTKGGAPVSLAPQGARA
ncbi:MAG: Gfo/Idh/MocA family oxidoreductase [Candidatus Obscuribacterales bacterium]